MPPSHLFEAVNIHGHGGDWVRLEPSDGVENQRWLGPLCSLNVLIGPNNCGKSRLLRLLFEKGIPGAGVLHTDAACRKAQSLLRDRVGAMIAPLRPGGRLAPLYPRSENAAARDLDSLIGAAEGVLSATAFLFGGHADRAASVVEAVATALADAVNDQVQRLEYRDDISQVVQHARELARELRAALKGFSPNPTLHRVYLPVLRGLRPLGIDEYRQRTMQDFFPSAAAQSADPLSASKPGEIVTGQELYNQVNGAKRGMPAARRSMEAFEGFLSRAFFEGARVEVTASIPEAELSPGNVSDRRNRILHVKVGREKERPIHELGDGIAHILMMTLPMFLHRDKNLLLFIEEPELFLHPGFQRLFIEALLEEPCEGGSRQVFVATHSPQFVDLTLESSRVSVFHCRKTLPEGDHDEQVSTLVVRAKAHGSFPLLRELGVLNSSVFLANCTIWVEGITDRMYLRRYFGLYREYLASTDPGHSNLRFVEDLHYGFVEYGGSNVTHWSFLDDEAGIRPERLCGELCLVVDDDGVSQNSATPARIARHKKLRAVLGDRFFPLPCREIENLLTPAVIAAVLRETEADPELSTEGLTEETYRHCRFGEFLDKFLSSRTAATNPPGRSYAGEYGALKDKVKFAERATRAMNRWQDLSESARALVMGIYAFVERCNAPARATGRAQSLSTPA